MKAVTKSYGNARLIICLCRGGGGTCNKQCKYAVAVISIGSRLSQHCLSDELVKYINVQTKSLPCAKNCQLSNSCSVISEIRMCTNKQQR